MEKLGKIVGWIIGIGFLLAILSYCTIQLTKSPSEERKAIEWRKKHPVEFIWE